MQLAAAGMPAPARSAAGCAKQQIDVPQTIAVLSCTTNLPCTTPQAPSLTHFASECARIAGSEHAKQGQGQEQQTCTPTQHNGTSAPHMSVETVSQRTIDSGIPHTAKKPSPLCFPSTSNAQEKPSPPLPLLLPTPRNQARSS
jgi:hypothetical protein